MKPVSEIAAMLAPTISNAMSLSPTSDTTKVKHRTPVNVSNLGSDFGACPK